MTARFLSDLDVRQIGWRDGRPLWLTLADLRYRSDHLGLVVVIPAEFITDGASVPRWPLVWLIAGGRGNRSAVLHDFPYQFGFWWILTAAGERKRLDVPKELVDLVFLESLRVDPMSGAGPTVAAFMYRGVRVGGRGVWADAERAARLNPEWSASLNPRTEPTEAP